MFCVLDEERWIDDCQIVLVVSDRRFFGTSHFWKLDLRYSWVLIVVYAQNERKPPK